MNDFDIAFPNLGIELHNIPYGFTVFGFFIALYAVIIACGMFAAVSLCDRIAKREGIKDDTVWELAYVLLPCGIVGARLYYVLFRLEDYAGRPLDVFNIRQGGLAIYGGVLAGFLVLYVFSRRKKLSFLKLADIVMNGALLGQVAGRWGNFTNREAFGGYTDNLFAMRLPLASVRDTSAVTEEMLSHMTEAGVNYIQVHPTFLYESAWNLCLLVFVLWYRKRKRFDGEITLLYLGGYGLGRFLIEGLRTDQLLIPGTRIAVSQMLAFALVVFAAACFLIKAKKKGEASLPEKQTSPESKGDL